jgi:hypothetical protein
LLITRVGYTFARIPDISANVYATPVKFDLSK